MMELQKYLDRIAFKETPKVDLDTLTTLQRLQQENISYENIDVLLGIPLVLKNEVLYDKMIVQGRGGWCHELNGILQWALQEIGFDSFMVNINSNFMERGYNRDFDHMGIVVTLEGQRYFADAGSSRTVTPFKPMPLIEGHVMDQPNGRYNIRREGDYWKMYWQLLDEPDPDKWSNFNRFTLTPHVLEDFQETCDIYQAGLDTNTRPFLFDKALIVKRDHCQAGYHLILGDKYRFYSDIGSTKRITVKSLDQLSIPSFGQLLNDPFCIKTSLSKSQWDSLVIDKDKQGEPPIKL